VKALAAFRSSEVGQSLVEVAMALPLLLVSLLGLVDVGRAFVYQTAVTNAAREAALYAAKDASVTLTQVTQKACNETGFSDWGSACASGVTVTCTGCGTAGADVTVDVAYQFSLTSGYLFKAMLGTDQFVARGSATFRSLTQ